MSLNLPDYKGRDVGKAAFIEGSDEGGGKNDPEVIAIARARHLNFAVRVHRDGRVADVARDFGARRG
jgi:hypothetical protein